MIESNYISLKKAAQYCDYSQDYLKLRARQGRLKAVKFGRNWVTTVDWVREYNGQRRYQEVRPPLKFERRLDLHKSFKMVGFVVTGGLAAYLIFLLLDFGYLELNIKDFLANIGSLIPGRVIEIR